MIKNLIKGDNKNAEEPEKAQPVAEQAESKFE